MGSGVCLQAWAFSGAAPQPRALSALPFFPEGLSTHILGVMHGGQRKGQESSPGLTPRLPPPSLAPPHLHSVPFQATWPQGPVHTFSPQLPTSCFTHKKSGASGAFLVQIFRVCQCRSNSTPEEGAVFSDLGWQGDAKVAVTSPITHTHTPSVTAASYMYVDTCADMCGHVKNMHTHESTLEN